MSTKIEQLAAALDVTVDDLDLLRRRGASLEAEELVAVWEAGRLWWLDTGSAGHDGPGIGASEAEAWAPVLEYLDLGAPEPGWTATRIAAPAASPTYAELAQRVCDAEEAYARERTQGPGSRYEALAEAAKQLALASGQEPRLCQHHRYYPGDDSLCRGEPSQYCETLQSLGRRLAGAWLRSRAAIV